MNPELDPIEQLYLKLALSPESVMLDSKNKNNTRLIDSEYELLTECHCVPELSRGKNNFRDYAEDYLVQVAKTKADNLKVLVLGSGHLLQTAILLAKLSGCKKKIQLDLVDPKNHTPDLIETVGDFIKLITNMGFKLDFPQLNTPDYAPLAANCNLASKAKFKGNVKLVLHDDSNAELYRKTDIVFVVDVPIEIVDLNKHLEDTSPGTFCISARKIRTNMFFAWAQDSKQKKYYMDFEVRYKNLENYWVNIIKTSKVTYPLLNIPDWQERDAEYAEKDKLPLIRLSM